jgi:hypothetical protein
MIAALPVTGDRVGMSASSLRTRTYEPLVIDLKISPMHATNPQSTKAAHVHLRGSDRSPNAVMQPKLVPAASGRSPQLAPGEVEFGASWTTSSNGQVQASSVPAGDYLACVQKPNSPLLDPCVWAKPISVTGLQAQEQRNVGTIIVQLGTLVQISVLDPLGLLPAWSDISSDGGLIVGIFHDGRTWTPAMRNPSKAFSVAVPTGHTYQLWASSRQFNVSVPGVSSTSATGVLSSTVVGGSEPAGGYVVSIIGLRAEPLL